MLADHWPIESSKDLAVAPKKIPLKFHHEYISLSTYPSL
jgi:hypothetical protein